LANLVRVTAFFLDITPARIGEAVDPSQHRLQAAGDAVEIEICRPIDVLVPGRKAADMKGAGARNEAGKAGILREEPCVSEPARYCSASALACQQSGRCHHKPNAIVIWLS